MAFIQGSEIDVFFNGTEKTDEITNIDTLSIPTETSEQGSIVLKGRGARTPRRQYFTNVIDLGTGEIVIAYDPANAVHAELWKAAQTTRTDTFYFAVNRMQDDPNPRLFSMPVEITSMGDAVEVEGVWLSTVSFTNVRGEAPVSRFIPDQSIATDGGTATLNPSLYFAGTTALTYTAESDDVATATVAEPSATSLVVTAVKNGTVKITVTATDTSNRKATANFNVVITEQS